MKHICSSSPPVPPHWPFEIEILQRITARFMERQGSKLEIVTISYVPSVLIGEVLRDCAFCTVQLGIKFINTICSSGCVHKPINSGIFFFFWKTNYSWRSILRRCLRILLYCELWKSSKLWHISGLVNFNNKNASITVYFMDYSAINIQ